MSDEKSPFDEATVVFDYGEDQVEEPAPAVTPLRSDRDNATRGGWFVEREGRSQGPLTQLELERLILTGQLVAETRIWRRDFSDWQAAISIPGLAPLFESGAPASRDSEYGEQGDSWEDQATSIALDKEIDQFKVESKAKPPAAPPPLPPQITKETPIPQLRALTAPEPSPENVLLDGVVAPPAINGSVDTDSTKRISKAPVKGIKTTKNNYLVVLVRRIFQEIALGARMFFEWVDDVSSTRRGLIALIGGGALFVSMVFLLVALVVNRSQRNDLSDPLAGGTVNSTAFGRLHDPENEGPLSDEEVVQVEDLAVTLRRKQNDVVTLRQPPPRRYADDRSRPAGGRSLKDKKVLDELLSASEVENGGDDLDKKRSPSGSLTAEQIRHTMNSLRPQVVECFQRYQEPGTVKLKMSVEPKGSVTVSIVGEFRGSNTGACIADAASRLQFPRFAGEPIDFIYPYRLRAD